MIIFFYQLFNIFIEIIAIFCTGFLYTRFNKNSMTIVKEKTTGLYPAKLQSLSALQQLKKKVPNKRQFFLWSALLWP